MFRLHGAHRLPRAGARRGARGITLIELMVALAVVALLLSVALPSYRDSVRKSTRAEAQAWMLAVAGRQQQFLVDRRAYAGSIADVGIAVPASVAAAYTLELTVQAGPPPGFSLDAVPKDRQVGERCGSLAIDQAGVKAADVEGCW
jgi:type IV pilus assembly protein PilE